MSQPKLEKLPSGWSQGKLAELISRTGIISDGDWIESKDQDPTGSVRLVQLADIGDGKFVSKSSRFMTPEAASRLNCTYLKLGDVLIARMPNPLGRACIFPKVENNSVTVVDVCLIRISENSAISNELIKSWINSPQIRSEISLQATGSTRKRITRKKLEAFNFPVPPVAEQKRIVEKLDSLLAQVDSIQQRLNRLPTIIKRFRQSILAAAVSGKLTEQWREVNKNCEWELTTIGDTFLTVDGDRGSNYPKKEEYHNEGYCLFLSTKNVRPFGFDFSKTVFLTEDKHRILRKGKLERGDIIITTRGTLGNVASYDETINFPIVRINSGMLILRKKNSEFINDFFKFVIASPKFQKDIDEKRTGSAQPQLPANILKTFEFFLPSIQEQTEIVRLVEQYFALADTLEKNLKNAKQRVDHLTQSILAKAFKGELVAQDPRDEPSEQLLARIKAARLEAEALEKAAALVKKKTAKSKTKKKK